MLVASRRSLPAVLLMAALSSAACRRAASGPPPERWVSARAEAVVVVPELRRASRELRALHDTAAGFPGDDGRLAAARGALAAQLGLDLLDPESLAGGGLEPSRGAALGVEPAGGGGDAVPVLILPVRDRDALEKLVARLARERFGAAERTASTQGAVEVIAFRAAAGGPPALALATLGAERTAALAPGPGGPAAAAAALSRPAAESLAESAAWRELRRSLGERYALVTGAVPPSPRLHVLVGDALVGVPAGYALGASAADGSLRLGLVARLGPGAEGIRALRAGQGSAPVRTLAPDAALALAWNGDPAALGRNAVPRLAARDREWLAAHGLDLQRDLFDVLAPGVAASVSLSPRLDLTALSDLELRADPLRAVHFELVAEVKDEAAAGRSLARLPALFTALAEPVPAARPTEARADPSGRSGRIVTPSGELAWRLEGKRLAMAGGVPGALDALLARAGGAGGYAAPTQAAAAALKDGLGGAVLSPPSLARSVRALPEDAFGTGPTGFVVRSMVERFLEPAERLSAVSLRADLDDAALRLELLLETAPAGKGEQR